MPDVLDAEVVVLGAGAAGLFCAAMAAQRGRRVLVLDHGAKLGRKILISGGGRCNFTNLGASPANYLSENPHFARSALARYTPQDFLALVRRHGIPFHEKTLGQQFCDRSAKDILELLLAECRAGGVEIRTGVSIGTVEKPNRFVIATSSGPVTADRVVVATGGLSLPTIGATGIGYDIARRFGLPIIEPVAALVPFTLAPADLRTDLAGLSCEVEAATGAGRFREAMLFTHKGLSGPAILQASSYWTPGQPLELDLYPAGDLGEVLSQARQAKTQVLNHLATIWPRRLADYRATGPQAVSPLNALAEPTLRRLGQGWQHLRLTPAGTEGWRTAEVTRGGVDTRALSSKTMEAREVPGLHFIGEVVDVTGWLGGYNFQWAWSSGWACAEAV